MPHTQSQPATQQGERDQRVRVLVSRLQERSCNDPNLDRTISRYRRVADVAVGTPTHSVALSDLGVLYASLGLSAKAQTCFSEALLVDPNNTTASANLVRLQEACWPAPDSVRTSQPSVENGGADAGSPGNREVFGFMHLATVNHWQQIVDEQLTKMRASGLWGRMTKLFVGVVGPEAESINFNDPKIEVVYRSLALEEAEVPTLAALQGWCQHHACDVFYVHTKGVTRPGPGVVQWRHLMEHFLLLSYKDCLFELQVADACGVEWTDKPWPHFSGNFWWARSEHINKLPDVRYIQIEPEGPEQQRHVAEQWIGMTPCNAANLHHSDTDHYTNTPYPRSNYAKLLSVQSRNFWPNSAWRGLENRFQDLLEPIGPIRTVVELGVEYGYSLFSFAQAMPYAQIIGFDPYETIDDNEADARQTLGTQTVTGSTSAKAWVQQRLSQYPNVSLFTQLSTVAADQFSGVIDVLHIDALHTYDAVKSDFEAWAPKLRTGGCVLFHDTESYPNDVGRFFSELCGRKAWLQGNYGLGAWYKP